MKKSNIGLLLVLLVFALFMVSVLMVLMTGADVIQDITVRNQESYGQRTAVQYIATRVRQADQSGMIYARSTDEGDQLVLAEEIEGALFETTLYCYDGYLRELFCASGNNPGAEFGEKILPAEHFFVMDCGDYLELELIFADGEKCPMIIHIRSERGSAA